MYTPPNRVTPTLVLFGKFRFMIDLLL